METKKTNPEITNTMIRALRGLVFSPDLGGDESGNVFWKRSYLDSIQRVRRNKRREVCEVGPMTLETPSRNYMY